MLPIGATMWAFDRGRLWWIVGVCLLVAWIPLWGVYGIANLLAVTGVNVYLENYGVRLKFKNEDLIFARNVGAYIRRGTWSEIEGVSLESTRYFPEHDITVSHKSYVFRFQDGEKIHVDFLNQEELRAQVDRRGIIVTQRSRENE